VVLEQPDRLGRRLHQRPEFGGAWHDNGDAYFVRDGRLDPAHPAEAGAAFGGIAAVAGYAVGESLPMLVYMKLGPRIRALIPEDTH